MLLQLIRATIMNGAYRNQENISPIRIDFENGDWKPRDTDFDSFKDRLESAFKGSGLYDGATMSVRAINLIRFSKRERYRSISTRVIDVL